MASHDKYKKAYVRTSILNEMSPPENVFSGIAWIKENLLSSPLNVFLTVVSSYFLFSFVSVLSPWFLNSIWNAGSLSECREILMGEEGACFAIIRDRGHQLLFGFYPKDAYWRLAITFILMLFALAPILFPALPRRLLWIPFFFPAVSFWLLWGGTAWFVVVVMAGFGLGYLIFQVINSKSTIVAVLAAILVPLLWWSNATDPIVDLLSQFFPINISDIRSESFGGFMISIVIGVTGISASLPLGVLLALGRKSDMPLVRWVCVMFIEFIRGVPLITLLFTASLLLNYFLPPGTSFDITLRVIIMVTIFSTAYMAEIIRGGLAAIDRGQQEAANALGLDYWQSQRLIIMPQALRISIPGIINTYIATFKDTTLVVFIGILDPIGFAGAIRAHSDWNGVVWELYGFIALCFFVFCFSMSRYSIYLEHKLNTDNR
ncbi:MAG: general L-amino acid transport system permease protein [Paracoccaceae bacterium]|jgi:general L-amino acid transport system permease protein